MRGKGRGEERKGEGGEGRGREGNRGEGAVPLRTKFLDTPLTTGANVIFVVHLLNILCNCSIQTSFPALAQL